MSATRSGLFRLILMVAVVGGTVTRPASSAEATATVAISGSSWLGGQGVNVCLPGTDENCGVERHVGGVAGNYYECVELAQRLYQALGWHGGIFANVGTANEIFDANGVVAKNGTAVRGVVHDPDNVATTTTSIMLAGFLGDPQNGAPLNVNPVRRQRAMDVQIVNASGQMVFQTQLVATQAVGTGRYNAHVSVPTIPSGYYQIKIRLDHTLFRLIQGISTIAAGQRSIRPLAALVVGDVNGDNQVNILDYNLLLNCYSDLAPPVGPCDSRQKTAADLNDDAFVNLVDTNIFLRVLAAG